MSFFTSFTFRGLLLSRCSPLGHTTILRASNLSPHNVFARFPSSRLLSSAKAASRTHLAQASTGFLHVRVQAWRRQFSTTQPWFIRNYPRPNPQPRRYFLDRIPPNAVFYGIIGLNSAVFLMWFMATQKYKQERDPSAVFWMQRNFLTSWDNLVSGRIWTPLAACFSHKDLSHILFNGFTFFFMAKPVLQLLGSRQFIFLYLGGGLVSSFTSLAYSKWMGRQSSSHGASGAIYSIISFLACVAPTMTFQLYGIIPIPAWLVVTGVFSYDLYSTLSNQQGTTDTVGHVGGLLAGAGYFIIRRLRPF